MLDEKFKNQGLFHFDYKKTLWFEKIERERTGNKRKLFFWSLAISLFIPVFIIIAAYTKNSNLMYFPFIVLFPVIAIQFNGSKKGNLFSGVFLLVLSLCYLGNFLGIIPAWTEQSLVVQFLMNLVSYCSIWLLSLTAERRQESLIYQITDMLVFDESTGLPDRDVLLHSIRKDKSYIFAIIKIENFSDLVALFGYEFSDVISLFASQKLKKNEKIYTYTTYQLKYNEYGILIECEAGLQPSSAAQKIHKIITSLEIEALPWEQDKIRLVYRVGATLVYPNDGKSFLSCADIALKKAENTFSVLRMFDGDYAEKTTAYESVIKFTELITNRKIKV